VLERFTEPARQVVARARDEARLLRHHYVGTEHLFFATNAVDDDLAAALRPLGITTEVVRGQVARMVAPGDVEPGDDAPFTPEATRAVEAARREALHLGHAGVAPAHVVLGLLRVHDGTMPVLLARLGVPGDALRAAALAVLRESADGVASVAAVAGPTPPLCPRCGEPLDEAGRVRVVSADADAGPVRLVACVTCGVVLGVLA
jgi:ATP-dependent Clp protease ATP-binding subunit ClpC